VLGLVVANAWCRFACPSGGLLELFKGISIFKFYKTSDCNDCNRCLQLCELGTRPAEVNCTNCGDCLDACPQDAIRFGRKAR
jgi:ferredoxin-type protein NapH